MKLLKSGVFYLAVLALTLALCTQEVEGRRKILMGRKAITRTYLRGMAVPAYVIVILIGLAEIIIGAAMYVAMRKLIITTPVLGSYVVAPVSEP